LDPAGSSRQHAFPTCCQQCSGGATAPRITPAVLRARRRHCPALRLWNGGSVLGDEPRIGAHQLVGISYSVHYANSIHSINADLCPFFNYSACANPDCPADGNTNSDAVRNRDNAAVARADRDADAYPHRDADTNPYRDADTNPYRDADTNPYRHADNHPAPAR
jgi:hypothetical protein